MAAVASPRVGAREPELRHGTPHPGLAEALEGEQEKDDTPVLRVSFLGGEECAVQVGPEQTVADLKRKLIALRGKPHGYNFLLFSGARQAENHELAVQLAAAPATAVFSASELSYRTLSADRSEVWHVGPYDRSFSEAYARLRANVAPETWLPAPPDHPTSYNLAKMSLGASVKATGRLLPDRGPEGQERLDNLLRLGAAHGDPRFAIGQSFFELRAASRGTGPQQEQHRLTIDLGRVAVLVRVGFTPTADSPETDVRVETCVHESPSVWDQWGFVSYRSFAGEASAGPGPPAADRRRHALADCGGRPRRARWIRLECHRSPRFGHIFAYGWEGEEGGDEDAASLESHQAPPR